MPNYDNSKIYKIVCRDTDLIYIGSTTKKLNLRANDHKASYKRFIDGKANYYSSFRIIENDNYYYEIIEELSCLNRRELEIRERYWLEIYQKDFGELIVNERFPTRTWKERNNCIGKNSEGRFRVIMRYVARVRERLSSRKKSRKILSKVGKNSCGRYKLIIRYVSRIRARLRYRKNALMKKEQNKS